MRPDDQWTDYRPATAPVLTPARTARTALVVLTAFLVEVVVIAAGCNQKVADHARQFLDNPKHQSDFFGQVVRAGQTYDWRVSGQTGPPHHLVLSQWAMLATLFVLSALLVFALARGAVTFGRAFLGVWLAVIVATEVAAIVQFLVVDDITPPHVGRLTNAVFAGPNGYNFFAGLCLGLVTALIAATVAVGTRRPEAAEAPVAPWDPSSGGLPAAAPANWSDRDREQDRFATTQYPVYPPPAPASAPLPSASSSSSPLSASSPPPPPPWAESGATRPATPIARPDQPAPEQPAPETQVPAKQAPAPAGPTSPEAASDKTTQIPRLPPPAADDDPNKTTMLPRTFPRPPDDEDLGHQPE